MIVAKMCVYIGLLLTEICILSYSISYYCTSHAFHFFVKLIIAISLKSEQKLVEIVHVSRQKLLQHAKACKNTSGKHRVSMQLV